MNKSTLQEIIGNFSATSNTTRPATSAGASLYDQSMAALRNQFTPSLCWIVFGLLGLTLSLLVLIVVLRSKQLHGIIHYNNVLHLSTSDTLLCLAYFASGLKRVIKLVTASGDVNTPLQCAFEMFATTFAIKAQNCQTLAMASSRVLALTFPLLYRNAEARRMHAINVFWWLVAFVISVATMFGTNTSVPLVTNCVFNTVLNQWASLLANNSTLGLNIVSAACVVILAVLIFRMHRKAFKSQERLARTTKSEKLELIAAKTALIVAFTYFVSWILPSTYVVQFLAVYDKSLTSTVAPYANAVYALHATVNFLVFLLCDSNFRRSLMSVGSRKNSVNVSNS